MSTDAPVHLLLGPDAHGVTRYALQVAGAVGARAVRDEPGAGAARVHLHVTDGLLGRDVEAGLARVEAMASAVPTTLTLHDVPQPTDGAERLARRAVVYRRLAAAARGVVCNSEHERAALGALDLPDVPVHVVPLPVVPSTVRPATGARGPEVGVLGFVYPGKGHADAIRAAAEVNRRRVDGGDPAVRVVALGAVADGHDADVRDLHALADGLGVALEVTGHLDDGELDRRAAEVAVPVAAHRNVSASGSINSWLAVRRRPLVLAGRYTREMDALRPGTTTLFVDGGLADAVASALDDPASTRLADSTSTAPHLVDVARSYSTWWDTEVTW